MKNIYILLVLLLASITAFAQTPAERTSPLKTEYRIWRKFPAITGTGTFSHTMYSKASSSDIPNALESYMIYYVPLETNYCGQDMLLYTLEKQAGNTMAGTVFTKQLGECILNNWWALTTSFRLEGDRATKLLTATPGTYKFNERLERYASGGTTCGGAPPPFNSQCRATTLQKSVVLGGVDIVILPDLAFTTSGQSLAKICMPTGLIDMSAYVNNTVDGAWSIVGDGSKFSGHMFNPTGLANGDYMFQYTVNAMNGNQTISKTITIETLNLQFDLPSELCQGDAINLYSYTNYSSGVVFSGSGVSGNILNFSSAGSKNITATLNSGGCSANITESILMKSKIDVTLTSDASICNTENIQLNANTSVAGVSFSWSPTTGLNNANISNPLASPSTTTNYTVTLSKNGDCSNQKSVQITVLPQILGNVVGVTTHGYGNRVKLEFAQTSVFSDLTYTWSSDDYLINNPVFENFFYQDTTFDLTLTVSKNGLCEFQQTKTITVTGEEVELVLGADGLNPINVSPTLIGNNEFKLSNYLGAFSIVSISGKVLASYEQREVDKSYRLDYPKGIYLIKTNSRTFKVVKQ